MKHIRKMHIVGWAGNGGEDKEYKDRKGIKDRKQESLSLPGTNDGVS